MTDAEIFKRNVKRICKQKHMKMGCVDIEAGYNEKHVSEMAYKGSSITTEHIRAYARVLGVKPGRLIEGRTSGHCARSRASRLLRSWKRPDTTSTTSIISHASTCRRRRKLSGAMQRHSVWSRNG